MTDPSTILPDDESRRQRARLSLEGLSIGDAFGQQFFARPDDLAARRLPPAPWPFTDDTVMALAIVETLERFGRIEQDALARTFARRYADDPGRGYGGMAHQILAAIHEGVHWSEAAGGAFGGAGSMGNGAAMRAAPVGAWFADDLYAAAAAARASAEVTHAHPEGQAGAIAVAVAAACAWRLRGRPPQSAGRELLEAALHHTPEGWTRDGIACALALPPDAPVDQAVAELGNGSRVLAPDTVPFTLWCAAGRLGAFSEALWTSASGFGDMDTTCAIVGGIVVLFAGGDSIPEACRKAREPLPEI